jgi:hypothetical protein
MKKIIFIPSISILFLFTACTKNVDTVNPTTITETVTKFVSKSMVRDLGNNTVLTVTMTPVITCYSFKNGEIPKPCTIFIDITCALSKPISRWLKIEINRTLSDTWKLGQSTLPSIVINMASNTEQSSMKSNFTNQDNVTVPDIYSIGEVSMFDMVY